MAPKAKSKSTNTPSTPSVIPAQNPNWPSLTPLPSPYDLALSSLVPDQIITVSRLFTSSLAQKYVSFLKTLPLVTTPGKPKRGDAVRVNDRFQIDDPDFARRLWEETSLRSLVMAGDVDGEQLGDNEREELWGGDVLGLNPNIRIYRYSEGQFFDQHYDDTNNVSFPSDIPGKTIPARTTWTLLLYLTVCEGGETVFYPDPPVSKKSRQPTPPPVSAAPEVGLALFHRHGNECMLHEGREVTKGEKWVLRSDLCVRR